MRNVFFSLIIVLSSFLSISAKADSAKNRWYTLVGGGVSVVPDKRLVSGTLTYDTGVSGRIGIGYLPEPWDSESATVRLEMELGYHRYKISNSTSRHNFGTAMANIYYDFNISDMFRPYVGAGGGITSGSLSDSGVLGETEMVDNKLAWQLMGGISYYPPNLSQFSFDVGYRYLNLGSMEYWVLGNTARISNLQAHNAEVSFRYHF